MLFQHFDWDLTHQVLFLYILPSHHMNLRDQPWRLTLLWYRTDNCSCKLSAKVSLMLNNPFPVPSLCKLNHSSIFFHRDQHENHRQTASSLQGKPWVFFGSLGKFQNNIEISIKTARVSRLSFHFLWIC